MQSSKQGIWKGYHLLIEGLRKGYLFHRKVVFQRVRDWTSGQNLPVWKFVEYAPPLQRGGGGGLLHVFWNFPRVWFRLLVSLQFLVCYWVMHWSYMTWTVQINTDNRWVHFLLMHLKVMFTRGDSQQRFLAQHGVAKLLRYWFKWLQQCSNIAGTAVLRLAVSGC